MRNLSGRLLFSIWLSCVFVPCLSAETTDWYYREGPLRGSLKSDAPLPLYDSDPEHLWNRLFAVFYIRPSQLPSRPEYPQDSTKLEEWDQKLRNGKLPAGPVVKRFEGGDTLSLLAWGQTRYYSEPGTFTRADKLLDEFITTHAERLIDDPLKRAFLQRDLWAVFDHLIGQNIARYGDGDLLRRGALDRETYGGEKAKVSFDDPEAIERRKILCRKLAVIIRRLAQPRAVIQALPDNYALAIESDQFASQHNFDYRSKYLPPGLLTCPDEWVEIDTSPEPLNFRMRGGQIDYVSWFIRGRSYYRVFWRFAGGRKAVEEYLKYNGGFGPDRNLPNIGLPGDVTLPGCLLPIRPLFPQVQTLPRRREVQRLPRNAGKGGQEHRRRGRCHVRTEFKGLLHIGFPLANDKRFAQFANRIAGVTTAARAASTRNIPHDRIRFSKRLAPSRLRSCFVNP